MPAENPAPAPAAAAVPPPAAPHQEKDDDILSRLMRRDVFDWDEPLEPSPLSDDVEPLHYELIIRPDIQRLRSEGEVAIKCRATKPVREITLSCHSSLSIRHLSLIAGERTHTYDTSSFAYSFLETSGDVKLDRRRGQLVIQVPTNVTLDEFELLLAFTGSISEKPQGLFHCSYSYTGDDKCMDDLQHYALFTGSNIHHVFPCFNEPRFKATVRLSVIGWLDRKALSTTAVDEEAYWSGQTRSRSMRPASSGLRSSKITRFKATPAIALGELAFAFGEFKAVSCGPVSVWTTPEHEQGMFAAEVLAKALPEMARFGAPAKLDILAVGNLKGEAEARPGLLIALADHILVDSTAPLSTQIDAGLLLIRSCLERVHTPGVADFLARYIVAPKCFPEWETRATFWSDRERPARRFQVEDLDVGSAALVAASYRELGEEAFLQAVMSGNYEPPASSLSLIRHLASSWEAGDSESQAILLSDCWAYARAGEHALSSALDLVKKLAATSDSHIIWDTIAACIDDLPELAQVVAPDAERVAKQLGWSRQSQVLPARLQATVVRIAIEQSTILTALQEAAGGEDVPPELRGPALRAALRKDPTAFSQLKDTYLDTLDPAEKADALYALFSEPSVATRSMDLLRYGRLDEPDVPIAVAHLSQHYTTELWSWIKDDWYSINRKYDLEAILRNALRAVKAEDVEDLTKFATEKGKSGKMLAEMLAPLPERLAANTRDADAIATYLRA